jgi:type I restriction enzyme, S subunit
MSSEWKTYQLDELCEFTNGFAFKSTDYVEASAATIEVLRMGYICRGGGFKEDSTPVFVPRAYGKSLEKYILKTGDVVIAMTDMKDKVAILGNTARIRHNIRFALNQRVGCIRVKRHDLLCPDFLYFYSNSIPHVDYLRSRANSGVQVNLSTSAIKESQLEIPPLAEQKYIASILMALDDRITLLRETNATLEAIAQALFKSWFVDFDPVHAKLEGRAPEGMDEATAALFPDGFEESELGLVPKGWRVGTLGDVAQTVRQQLQPADLHADIHYVGLEHIPRKSLSLASWSTADGLESAKATFSDGDILFGKLRPYFHKVVIAPFDGVCSTDILVCQAKKSAYYGFVAMQLFSTALVEYSERLSNGAKMPRVGWKDLAAYPVVLPSEPVAVEYTRAIEPLLARMKANVHETQTLATLRDTLLPRLISGQLRLPEACRSS